MRQPRLTPIFLMVLVFIATSAAPVGAWSELTPGTVPFGVTVDEALEQYRGADVTRDTTPYIESIGTYAIERYFKGGLQKDDSGICFLPGIVRKYTVRDSGRPDSGSLTFYFGAFEKGADDYRLFMVKVTGPKPPAGDDFTVIFEEMAAELDKETGSTHTVDHGRVQSFEQQAHAFYLPALIGTWEAGETLAFLMAANSPEGPLPPERIYVSRPALKRYQEVCKTY
jgi:hypothetical protein